MLVGMRGRAVTVAVVLTDIEGSTALLREFGDDRYARLLEEHHEAVRAAAKERDGAELSESGDGLDFLFPTVEFAVGAAVDLQQRLGSSPVRVRTAVHVGGVVMTAAGPVGLVLHECARLLAAASGRQILLSPAARAVLVPPPEGIELHDLGTCRLRDISDAWEVTEAVIAGHAPLRALRAAARPAGLPSTPTSFVGRGAELEGLVRSCATRRLITVAGPGGIGKTRLAIEAARTVAVGRRASAVLADLAPVTEEAVPATVLRALRPHGDVPAGDLLETITDALTESDAVVVLDNCEHVLDAAAQLAHRVSQTCAGVVVLATSREALDVAGELVVHVLPLDDAAAAALFLDRVGDVDADRAAGLAGSQQLIEIAQRLEGVPLAIELAAARARSVTAGELLEQLDQPLDALVGNQRDGLRRHRSMRAALDWSWDLLRAEQRQLLQDLSLFTGWFLAADAARVSGGVVASTVATLETLRSSSLLVSDMSGERSRFRLLQPVRQYASELLQQSDGAVTATARYVALQVEAAEDAARLRGKDPHLASRAFGSRRSDIAAATDAAVSAGDTVSAMRLVAATGFPWMTTDPAHGYRLARRVLDAATGSEPPIVRAGCLFGAGLTGQLAGDVPAARQLLDQAARAYRTLGAIKAEAWALYFSALNEMSTTGPERAARALLLFETPPIDPLGTAWVLTLLGTDHLFDDEPAEARVVMERAVEIATEHDVTHVLGITLSILGLVEAWEGQIDRGRELTAQGVELYRALGDAYQLINTVRVQAHVELLDDKPDAATEYLVETLRLTAELGSHEVTFAFLFTAELLRRRNDLDSAAYAHRIARRTWPHDEPWLQSARRYIARDTRGLDALPANLWPLPTTLRQQINWAIEHLCP
jgi:predicted ATPase/class 3 adenylate cyclase